MAEVTASDQFDPDSQPDATPDNDPPTQDDEATATPTVNPVADLSLTKTITLFTDVDGSGNISPNDIVLFTITVSNAGPNNATGVGVGDLLPSRATATRRTSPAAGRSRAAPCPGAA